MYAFVRIVDEKTNLTKFLLINWQVSEKMKNFYYYITIIKNLQIFQGEGAPIIRKGTCANHIIDVQKFLSGAHLTISARTEDDIDKDRILKQLSTVQGIPIRPKEQRGVAAINELNTPVGTNYHRVIPAKELNPIEMQNFWKKEEEEEKKERCSKILTKK